jgi:hypothetical protein
VERQSRRAAEKSKHKNSQTAERQNGLGAGKMHVAKPMKWKRPLYIPDVADS